MGLDSCLGEMEVRCKLRVGQSLADEAQHVAFSIGEQRQPGVLLIRERAAGLVSTLGVAMHAAFYYVPLAGLAQERDQALAAKAGAIGGDDQLLGVALGLFLLGTLAAILAMGLGLWRAGVLPWWGGLGVVVWLGSVVVGSELPAAALVNPVLLLPFAAVAARLRKPRETVPQAEWAVA